MNKRARILNFDDVIELCGSAATSRGRVYKTRGDVRELDWRAERNILFSVVQGTAAEPYRQRIRIEAHRIEAECTCPVAFHCKHIAASLLCWIDQQDDQPGETDQALRDVNRWVQNLVRQGRNLKPSTERNTPGEPLLLYQIDSSALSQNQKSVVLQIIQSRLLKRGGLGKESPYRYHSNYYHPDWVLPSDRAILDIATSRQGDFSYRQLTLDGDIGHLLIQRLVETGRCYWGNDRQQPLRHTENRTLHFDWRTEADSFKLDVHMDPECEWELVPSEPPWFVDTDRLLAGKLDGAPATAILTHLLDAPSVPQENAQTISNFLASRVADADLPLPMSPNFVRITSAPVPQLVLQSREDSLDIRHFHGSIRFRYDDYELPYAGTENDDVDSPLEGKTADGRPLVLHRDIARETNWVQRFDEQFTEFGQATDEDNSYYSRADRKPRNNDVQNIARQWHNLLARRDYLESAGWEVIVKEPFDLNFLQVTAIDANLSETVSNWFDMSLSLKHENQSFDLLPLVVEWLESESRDQSILLQADDGQWLEISPDLFKPIANTLLELFDDPRRARELRLPTPRAHTLDALNEHWQRHGIDVSWNGGSQLFSLADKLANFDGLTKPDLPDTLQASLRPYQVDGVAWLNFLAEYKFNGILADDMGLGKTLQTLTHLLIQFEQGLMSGPALVVVPTSLLTNWSREAARFTPTLSTRIWHGSDRKEKGQQFDDVNIVITSYALVTRDIEFLQTCPFSIVVLDEAQAIKNPGAKVSQALKTLDVERRLCLTGTPLENHLGELWSQFDFLMPRFLGSRKHFNRYFRTPIENHGSQDRQKRLNELIRPFLLRRRKEQVATDLPPKTEIVREVALEGEQARLYESIRITMERRVRQILAERGLAKSHIDLLDALLKLRQTCCHPQLVKLGSAANVKSSAKTELVIEMLTELISEGKKILLFSQFTEMLGLLEVELEKHNINYVKLTGRTRKREDVIDSFQNGDVPLFLISLKAGGTGLNLTAADTVIHYDPWWNPAVETQASDRAHRIGQDKPVFIYKLVASNTVEEKIMAMQQKKQQLADQTINESESTPLNNLTADDIMNLFSTSEPDDSFG